MEVILGIIVTTFGIKGEVKVHSNTDFGKKRYKKGNEVTLYNPNTKNTLKVIVNTYKQVKNMDVVSFDNYDTPEKVAKFIGYQILIDKPNDALPESNYYFADLLDCKVIANNIEIGKVIDIIDCQANKVLRIKTDNKDILYPFIDRFITSVDIENKTIILNPIEGMI